VGDDRRCHYLRAALGSFWAQARPVCDVDLIDYNDDSDDYDRVQALIFDALALARAELSDDRRAVVAALMLAQPF
jgi:hypothetical protein